MKQKGKLWVDAKGASIPEKYITALQKLQERNGQKIADEAKRLETLLRKAKLEFVKMCIEVFRNTPEAEKSKTGFTYYTFDREFRFEFSPKENSVRVYEATRPNPSAKDYRLMDLNFASIKVEPLVNATPTVEDHEPLKADEAKEIWSDTPGGDMPPPLRRESQIINPTDVPDERDLADQLPGRDDRDNGGSGSLLPGQD